MSLFILSLENNKKLMQMCFSNKIKTRFDGEKASILCQIYRSLPFIKKNKASERSNQGTEQTN